MTCVELGFAVEPSDVRLLVSRYFPSKIGGTPAWLDQANLPSSREVACGLCKEPTVLLLQIYAPDTEDDIAFHRTIFLTCCLSASCHVTDSARCFHVFRCQLPRRNVFYSFEPPDEDNPESEQRQVDERFEAARLCWVCGFLGEKSCAKCHTARYCSRQHQIIHWKNGHKEECTRLSQSQGGNETKTSERQCVVASAVFPQLELVIETEPEVVDEEKTDEQRMREYEEFVKREGSGVAEAADVEEFEREAAEQKHVECDKAFRRFKDRISREPEQVLRYQRHGMPLWVSDKTPSLPHDIPHCSCGSERTFEFQVMPQLLNYLKVDSLNEPSIDWGTLVVYTCKRSCNEGTPYHEEFIFKQSFNSLTCKETR